MKDNTKEDIEKRRNDALEEADRNYYDPLSVHYMDNDRYAWAVETINKKYDELNLNHGKQNT